MENLYIDLGCLVDDIKYYQEIAKLEPENTSSKKLFTRIGVSKNFVLERTDVHDLSIALKEESEGKGYDIRPMQLFEIDDFHEHECRLSKQLNVAVKIANNAGYEVACKFNIRQGQAILMGDPFLLELLETLKHIDDKMTSNSIPCLLLKPWQHLSPKIRVRELKRSAEMGFSRRNNTHIPTSKFQQPLAPNSTSDDVSKSKIGGFQMYEKFVHAQNSRFLTAQQSKFFDEIIDSISNAHSNNDLSDIKDAFELFEKKLIRNPRPKILEIKQRLNEKINELAKSGTCREPSFVSSTQFSQEVPQIERTKKYRSMPIADLLPVIECGKILANFMKIQNKFFDSNSKINWQESDLWLQILEMIRACKSKRDFKELDEDLKNVRTRVGILNTKALNLMLETLEKEIEVIKFSQATQVEPVHFCDSRVGERAILHSELLCTTKVTQKQNSKAISTPINHPNREDEDRSQRSSTLPSAIKTAPIEPPPQNLRLNTTKMSIPHNTLDKIDGTDSDILYEQLEHILMSIYQYSSTEEYCVSHTKLLSLIEGLKTESEINRIQTSLAKELHTPRAKRFSVMNSILNGAIQCCVNRFRDLDKKKVQIQVTELKPPIIYSPTCAVAAEITSAQIIVTDLIKCLQDLINQTDENEQARYQEYMWNILDQFGLTIRASESLSITYELANIIKSLHNHKFNSSNSRILLSTKELINDFVESLISERIDTQIKEAQQELSVVVVQVAHLVQSGKYTLQNKKQIQLDLSDFEKRAGRDAQLFNNALTWLKNAPDQPMNGDHFKCVLTCVGIDQVTFAQLVQNLESQDLAVLYSQAERLNEHQIAELTPEPKPQPQPQPKTEKINAEDIGLDFENFIYSQPLGMGKKLNIDKTQVDILTIKKQHHCFDTGSPARCISSTEFKYFQDVQKLEKGPSWLSLSFWLGKRSSGEEYRRPVTYLFENAPIRLYLNNEVVLLLDPVMLKPWAIFKSNAFTVRILNAKSELEKEMMLNQRDYRGYNFPIGRKGLESRPPKRLVNIRMLGQKMAERTEWRSSLDKNPTTSGHLLLNEVEATLSKSQRKKINSRAEYSNETFPHNEVICQPISPSAIQATTHYLSPDCFQGNHSIYFRLGMRLEQHIALFKLIKNDTQRKRLLFVVYLAERGALLEVGDLNSMLPKSLLDKCVKGQNASEVIKSLDYQMNQVCIKLRVNHQALQRMLMFAPLSNQLSWLDKQNSFSRNKDEWLEELWECVFATTLNIIEPQEISETSQQIIQYLYHCPISVNEMTHCLDQNKTPQDLNCRPSSSEAFVSAFCCQWMCQLLETEGVCFSEQEKLILIYSILIERTKLPKVKVIEIIGQLFGSVFDEGVLNNIKHALLNLNKAKPHKNARVALYRVIIQFSIDFIESLVNEKSAFNENTIRSSRVVKKYLFTGSTSHRFKSNLKRAMNGMIDVMIVNGLIEAKDERLETLTPQVRFGLRDDIDNSSEKRIEILKNRKAILDNHANISRGFTEQIKDQCKRELFLQAGVEVPNTMRLRQLKLPDSMMILDMLSSGNETQREANKEIVDHLKRNRWPLPIFHITKEQYDKIMREPRLKMAREIELNKRIPERVLKSYRSPTTIAVVSAIQSRNKILAIKTKTESKLMRDEPN